MKITDIIIFTFIFFISTTSFCQENYYSAFEINFDLGYTKVLSPATVYAQRSSTENLEVSNIWFARSKNFSFSYIQFVTPRHGIKLSFGRAEYGFDLEGRMETSRTPVRTSYRPTYLEWGASFIQKITLTKNANLILEPGLRYHSDASGRSRVLNFWDEDSFSFSGYTGVEIPMAGNNYFANLGFLFKIPLERYNYESDPQPALYPYFVGLRLGINYQFNWKSKHLSKLF